MLFALEALEVRVEQTMALICRTFDGVGREGGVSWSESGMIDNYESESVCAEARKWDTEPNWQALVDDPNWDHECRVGGFTFLDPVGFRYYLAPAMARELRSREVCCPLLAFHLTLGDSSEHLFQQRKWSALQDQEKQCVCEFLKCMLLLEMRHLQENVDWEAPTETTWGMAYFSYWRDIDADPLPLENEHYFW